MKVVWWGGKEVIKRCEGEDKFENVKGEIFYRLNHCQQDNVILPSNARHRNKREGKVNMCT